MKDLNKVLGGLKSVNSMDGITLDILKNAWKYVGPPLLDVINTSLESGLVPEEWKVSTVVPVPKVSGTNRACELRPINMLPIVEKVLEGVVMDQLKDYIKKNGYLAAEQSGFREGHSTETAVQLVVSNWLEAMDERDNMIGAVFLDFKRAFETIDRKLIIKKLS
jgi:hypothetical protein